VKRISWSQGLSGTADGVVVVPLAGAVAVRLLADRVGLTSGLSAALAAWVHPWPVATSTTSARISKPALE
jgi:hypothetical protein